MLKAFKAEDGLFYAKTANHPLRPDDCFSIGFSTKAECKAFIDGLQTRKTSGGRWSAWIGSSDGDDAKFVTTGHGTVVQAAFETSMLMRVFEND